MKAVVLLGPMALLATAVLFTLSCGRIPTAPRTEITVVGRVVGPSGEPVPETRIVFIPAEAALEDTVQALTSSTGAFSVRLLSGIYRVEVEPPYSGVPERTELVTVSGDDSRFDFALSSAPPAP